MKKYFLSALLALNAACAPAPFTENAEAELWRPEKVAVLPYQIAVVNKNTNRAVSPLNGAVHRGGEIISGARVAMDQILADKLRASSSWALLDQAEAARLLDSHARIQPIRAAALAAGRDMGADAVLIGFIYRLSQRVGQALSVESPASAAFDLVLLRVSDGQIIWSNSFDQTQVSLSENLLEIGQYVGRGLYWFTVEEFARYGMDEIFSRFPWPKP
ncbi:MAG: hypothetical protein LBJ14_09825 [Desulfarculales bacterium]|jgi:hypothetical protein|nr:hypothetical protein [Desulfarculales bacterium]